MTISSKQKFIVFIILISFVILFLKSLKEDNKLLCKDCNVILITMTNLRYDHMSSNGYFRPTTPNLDKLAKESLNFTNAFSHASWTLPSASSIFTSLYPFAHGVMNRHDGSKLTKDTPALVDYLNKNGYKTAAFTGGSDYFPKYGLTDRFLQHEECNKGDPEALRTFPTRYGEFGCTIPKALNWLKNNSSGKFFLFLQGFDAHCPFAKHAKGVYDPDYTGSIDFSKCIWTFDKTKPLVKDGKVYYEVYTSKEIQPEKELVTIDEADINHLIALYDEQVTATDRLLGEFLDEIKSMGLWENTIIIFTSEHGDILGKHGRFMRGGPLHGTFYDDVLHIPLLIKNPKMKPNKLDSLAQHIDIMPTILDLLGLKPPKNIMGKSLTPIIKGAKVNEYIFAGSEFNPGSRNIYYTKKTRIEVIRSNEWKLITEYDLETDSPSKHTELYDLKNDKEELNDLSGKRHDILTDLELKLNGWSKKLREK